MALVYHVSISRDKHSEESTNQEYIIKDHAQTTKVQVSVFATESNPT